MFNHCVCLSQETKVQKFATQIMVVVADNDSENFLEGLYQALTNNMDSLMDDLVFERCGLFKEENHQKMFLFKCEGAWMFAPSVHDMGSAVIQLTDTTGGQDKNCRFGCFAACGSQQWSRCNVPATRARMANCTDLGMVMVTVTPIDHSRGVHVWNSTPPLHGNVANSDVQLINDAMGLYSYRGSKEGGNAAESSTLQLDTSAHGDKRQHGTVLVRSDGRWCVACAPEETLGDASTRTFLRSEATASLTPVGLQMVEQLDRDTGQWQPAPAVISFGLAPENVSVSGWIWFFPKPSDKSKQQCHFHTVLGGFMSALKCPGALDAALLLVMANIV